MTTHLGPIFVGGLDRSGKTLLRLALSSHPNIAMTRRTYTWTEVYERYGDLGDPANFERCLAAMLANRHMAALQPDAVRIRREFREGQPTYGRLFALFHQHYAERHGKPRWGDQLAFIEHYADAVFAAYPSDRMIHMVRDPRDRYAAASAGQRGAGKAGLAAARWLASAELGQRNLRRYPGRYTIIPYEALMADRERTLRAVCAFIGEEFVPEMLTLEGAMRFGHEENEAEQPPDRQAGAPLSPREVAFVQSYAGRGMAAYGYHSRPLRLSLGDRLLFYCVDLPANLARAAAWRTLEGRRPA
jgi:hypothetical protein